MIWRVYPKGGSSRKWYISGPLWNGEPARIAGHRDRKVAEQMMRNIELLNRAKSFGQLPPESLATWIENLPEKEAKLYVELGLLERRLWEKRRPMAEFLEEYAAHNKLNCKPGSMTAARNSAKLKRVFTALGSAVSFKDLTHDTVRKELQEFKVATGRRKGQPIAKKTFREYVFAIKAFGDWMVEEKRAPLNPLYKFKAPKAKSARVRRRRPLEVADFSKLVAYLYSAPPVKSNQKFSWTAIDRLMVYWTAVMTGFRMNELRSLIRAHVDFDSSPVRVTVDGWVTKNGDSATIPIGDDIAQALRGYCEHMLPNTPLFRMPSGRSVLATFYRDLDAAGVRRRFDDGSHVDFHALRSTAICWWLTENRLHLLDVQFRARLSSLELVQGYVDYYAPKHAELVRNTPRVIDPNLPFRKVS